MMELKLQLLGGRGASSNISALNAEVKEIYNYVNNKKGNYVTIGANTKNFDRVINNAKSISVYEYDEMTGTRNEKTTKEEVRANVERFGKGKYGFEMTYDKSSDSFHLRHNSNWFYDIKLKK